MHKVAEGKLVKIARPMVLFSRIDELKLPELDNDDTELLEKHQDNGATLPVNTHSYPPHSPPEDALVAPAALPSLPRVKAGDSALQAQEGDLTEV